MVTVVVIILFLVFYCWSISRAYDISLTCFLLVILFGLPFPIPQVFYALQHPKMIAPAVWHVTLLCVCYAFFIA